MSILQRHSSQSTSPPQAAGKRFDLGCLRQVQRDQPWCLKSMLLSTYGYTGPGGNGKSPHPYDLGPRTHVLGPYTHHSFHFRDYFLKQVTVDAPEPRVRYSHFVRVHMLLQWVKISRGTR